MYNFAERRRFSSGAETFLSPLLRSACQFCRAWEENSQAIQRGSKLLLELMLLFKGLKGLLTPFCRVQLVKSIFRCSCSARCAIQSVEFCLGAKARCYDLLLCRVFCLTWTWAFKLSFLNILPLFVCCCSLCNNTVSGNSAVGRVVRLFSRESKWNESPQILSNPISRSVTNFSRRMLTLLGIRKSHMRERLMERATDFSKITDIALAPEILFIAHICYYGNWFSLSRGVASAWMVLKRAKTFSKPTDGVSGRTSVNNTSASASGIRYKVLVSSFQRSTRHIKKPFW